MAAVDSTGMEASRRSAYFARRSGRRCSRFPKLTAVACVETHLCLAVSVGRGPGSDDPPLRRAVAAALRPRRFALLLADAGRDAEGHHAHLYRRHGLACLIPPIRGRPAKGRGRPPGGFFRAFCARVWRRVKHLYGQRWQVESFFGAMKRKLGAAVTARRRHQIDRECHLRAITMNLMILARHQEGSG